jgi:hypothetical protein
MGRSEVIGGSDRARAKRDSSTAAHRDGLRVRANARDLSPEKIRQPRRVIAARRTPLKPSRDIALQ